MTFVEGIDVSSWQGAFDWPAWKGHIQFAACKATEGGFVDADFAHNWAGMKEIGVYRFAYHYAHPSGNVYDQVDLCYNTVASRGLEVGDNILLDFENTDGVDPTEVAAWGVEFCEQMNQKARGHRCVVYTYPYFAEQGNCAGMNRWFLWIANYNVAQPMVPSPWTNWTFWQYTDQGPGNIDHDRFYGTEAQLKTFCTTSGPYTR